jgi:predicted nicotinamide N-methyase
MQKAILTRNIQRTVPDAKLIETPLELCPELKLYLISADNIRRSFSQKEMGIIFDNPPYWTFCWASGHAPASYILKRELQVKGRTILDFGSGSGAVAIAAAMAGAEKVFACDNDDDALTAIAANADLNNVRIETCASVDEIADPLDIVIAADVFYDRENSLYLENFLHWAPEILVAESYLSTIGVAPYQRVRETTTTTVPDLDEAPDFRLVQIFRATGG